MGRWLRSCVLALSVSVSCVHAAQPAPDKAAPVVMYDAERCCVLVNGQPFFAIGCYDVVPERMPECGAAGFNLAVHSSPPEDDPGSALQKAIASGPAVVRQLLTAYPNAARRAGMWTLENPLAYSSYHYGQWSAHGSPTFDKAFGDFLSGPLPFIVDTLHDHPAVLGLMGFDEPGPDWGETLAAFHKAVRERDPTRGVVVNFCTGLQNCPESFEIATADYYPIRGRTPLIKILETTRADAEMARRLGRPFWFVPLVESFEKGPPLRPVDQVAQTYLAVVGGATGILWWAGLPRHVDNWTALKRLAGELRSLAPVLTERVKQPEVLVTTPDLRRTVQARVVRHGQVTFVIAVNAVPSAINAEFRLPGASSGKVNVWFEDRAVNLSAGRWSDHFAGLERHVYALQTVWPVEVPLQVSLALASPPSGEPAVPAVAMTGNLIADPGFESDSGWIREVFPTDEPGNAGRRCYLDTAVRHGGNRSGAIAFNDAGTGAAWDSQTVKLAPNTLYRYGAWARMESSGTYHTAGVVPATMTGHFPEFAEVENYAGWQEYSNLIWSGAEGREMWLRCGYGGANAFSSETSKGSGRVWFDDTFVVPAPADVRNMVLNGGFEGGEWLPGWPAEWLPGYELVGRPGCVGGAEWLWGLDHTVAWEGKASMRLANPGSGLPAITGRAVPIADAEYFLRGITLDAGRTYTLSAYMKADRPRLDVVTVAGGWESSGTFPVSDTWRRYTLSYTPTAAVRGSAFVFFMTKTPGTLWIDAVQFEEGAMPTEYRCWQ
jgi:hypothetical protein